MRGGNPVNSIILFLISILPGILWVRYFYKKDKYDPEPKSLIVRDFLWGLFSVFPASYLESPFSALFNPNNSVLTLLFASIFIVGFIEEGTKAYIIYILHFKNIEFDERVDGIIYSVTVGLGFAAAENLFYTMIYGYQVGLVRAFITTLAHASFTGIFGYFLGIAKIENKNYLIVIGLFISILLHGLYDFLVIGNIIGLGYVILIIIILQSVLLFLIKNVLKKSPFKN